VDTYDDLLFRVRLPARYLGGEVNSIRKEPARVRARLLLAFPELYELGMSHLGLQVLYQAVNACPDLAAERAFAPDRDLERELRAAGLPLASLESGSPLGAFDAVGFSLQHELNYPDLLLMLELGGVPARAAERGPEHPLVLAGGPCAANPEPLAEALDAVFLGEAERALPKLLRALGESRRRGEGRAKQLDILAGFPGIYLPARHQPRYDPRGRFLGVEPPVRVDRVWLEDFPALAPPARPVVPWVQTVHDRLSVEIQRGCTRGCRFCQAGMITRPVRQRGLDALLPAVAAGLASTGHDEVSLLSLSAGDHPQILPLLEAVLARHGADCVSVSLPSLRAETLTPELAERVRAVRKSGFTIAPEAGTERLRRVIHKELTDEDVLAAALGAFGAGWRLIKLYFMIGLPTETEADREGIAELVARLRARLVQAGHRPEIHVGISTFVPKAHTPFQWEAMLAPQEAEAAHARLRERLRRIRGVKASWTRTELAWAEGLLARGDRRLFPGLLALARGGARLSGWSEHFDRPAFEAAFGELAAELLAARDPDAPLPWGHLAAGPSPDFLRAERGRALAGESTPDCARQECSGCGVCGPGQAPGLAAPSPALEAPPALPERAAADPVAARLRLRLAKTGRLVHLSHLETMLAIQRALARADWPLAYSGGFHPRPRLSFGPACPVGVESRVELVDVGLRAMGPLEPLLEALRSSLPEELALLEARTLEAGEPGPAAGAGAVRYLLSWTGGPEPAELEPARLELLARAAWPVTRRAKGTTKRVDLRPGLLALEFDPPGARNLRLEVGLGAGAVPRPNEVAEALGIARPRIEREALLPRPAGVPGAAPEKEEP
jgi:radical SAM family uncharacterized protein/radical SAM-linked protein